MAKLRVRSESSAGLAATGSEFGSQPEIDDWMPGWVESTPIPAHRTGPLAGIQLARLAEPLAGVQPARLAGPLAGIRPTRDSSASVRAQ